MFKLILRFLLFVLYSILNKQAGLGQLVYLKLIL